MCLLTAQAQYPFQCMILLRKKKFHSLLLFGQHPSRVWGQVPKAEPALPRLHCILLSDYGAWDEELSCLGWDLGSHSTPSGYIRPVNFPLWASTGGSNSLPSSGWDDHWQWICSVGHRVSLQWMRPLKSVKVNFHALCIRLQIKSLKNKINKPQTMKIKYKRCYFTSLTKGWEYCILDKKWFCCLVTAF